MTAARADMSVWRKSRNRFTAATKPSDQAHCGLPCPCRIGQAPAPPKCASARLGTHLADSLGKLTKRSQSEAVEHPRLGRETCSLSCPWSGEPDKVRSPR